MEHAIGDRDLKRLPQRRTNIIDGSISSYCSILNSPEWLHMINKENELVSVLCDIESDRFESKEDRNKRDMEAEDHSKNKSEHNHIKNDYERLKGLDTCKVCFIQF